MTLSDLITGDILLTEWQGPLGAIIAARTGGPFSHASICVRDHDNVAMSSGLGLQGLDRRSVRGCLRRGDGITVMRLPLEQAWRDRARALCDRNLAEYLHKTYHEQSIEYDVGGLLCHFWPRWWWKMRPDPVRMPLAAICSEFASACVRRFYGIDPCPDWPDCWTTPNDLWRSPVLLAFGRLMADAGMLEKEG